MKTKLQDLTQKEMLTIDGGKKKVPKGIWGPVTKGAGYMIKNSKEAGKIDAKYKHGAPGRKY